MVTYYDNKSCVKISENLVFHHRLKHIEIKYHYICDTFQRRVIRLECISTNDQTNDVLTKSLPREKFMYFSDNMELWILPILLRGSVDLILAWMDILPIGKIIREA